MDIWSLFMTFKNWRWSSAVVILLLVHDWSGLVGAEQSIEVIVKWAAGNTCHNILNEAWCCRDAPAYIFCSSPAKITSSLLDFIVSEYEMQNSPFSLKSWLVLQCLSVVIFQPSLGVCVLNVCNCGLYFFFLRWFISEPAAAQQHDPVWCCHFVLHCMLTGESQPVFTLACCD